MTLLRKLTFLIVTLLVIFIITIFTQKFVFSLILFPIIICLSYLWYYQLAEELAIYYLMKNNNKMEIAELINYLGKKTIRILNRLETKKIVEQEENQIYLKTSDFQFSMTKWRPK